MNGFGTTPIVIVGALVSGTWVAIALWLLHRLWREWRLAPSSLHDVSTGPVLVSGTLRAKRALPSEGANDAQYSSCLATRLWVLPRPMTLGTTNTDKSPPVGTLTAPCDLVNTAGNSIEIDVGSFDWYGIQPREADTTWPTLERELAEAARRIPQKGPHSLRLHELVLKDGMEVVVLGRVHHRAKSASSLDPTIGDGDYREAERIPVIDALLEPERGWLQRRSTVRERLGRLLIASFVMLIGGELAHTAGRSTRSLE